MPYQRFVDDHPNIAPGRTVRKFFRRWQIGTAFFMGNLFARIYTDETPLNNRWYTRPDLKPYPAMVKDSSEYYDNAYQQLLEKNYREY